MSRELGNRMKEWRMKKGFSVQAAAQALHVSPSTYRDWEQGRDIQGEQPYIRLAQLYGIGVSELLTGQISGLPGVTLKFLQVEKLIYELREELASLF